MQNHNFWRDIAILALVGATVLGLMFFSALAHAQAAVEHISSRESSAPPVTLRGTVEQVLRHSCSSSTSASGERDLRLSDCVSIGLILQTKNGLLYASLGPVNFIRDQRFFFVDGDRLWVIGIPDDKRGATDLLVERVIKHNRELTLRDASGKPLWSPGKLRRSLLP